MGILQRSESRDGERVIWLAVHCTEGDDNPLADDARALRDAAWWTGSSHAIADDEPGSLLTPAEGCVPYELAAWTIRGGNKKSENIELVGRASWSRAMWLSQRTLLDLCARWLADRSKARKIPLRRLSLDEVRRNVPGVIGHVDYTNATGDGSHWDPGPGFPWDIVLAKANAYASGEGGSELPSVEELLNTKIDPNTGTLRQTVVDARQIARRAEERAKEAKAEAAAANEKLDEVLALLKGGATT